MSYKGRFKIDSLVDMDGLDILVRFPTAERIWIYLGSSLRRIDIYSVSLKEGKSSILSISLSSSNELRMRPYLLLSRI